MADAEHPRIANSLQSARPDQVIHVDRKGQVRSARRFQATEAGACALIAGGAVTAPLVIGGVAGVVAGLALVVSFGWMLNTVFAIRRAQRLLLADHLDEAAAALTRLRERRLVPGVLRGQIELLLASCRTLQGQFEAALGHARAATERLQKGGAHQRVAEYCVTWALIDLGRVAEARANFAAHHARTPDADFLYNVHWSTELYLAFAEGDHALDDDALHERSRAALAMTSSATHLALCAWAYHRRGDLDQAWHLLREAVERPDAHRLPRAAPTLQRWIDAHLDEARAAAPAED